MTKQGELISLLNLIEKIMNKTVTKDDSYRTWICSRNKERFIHTKFTISESGFNIY